MRFIDPATVAQRCCEYADTKPRKTPKWFALNEDRPLFAFAGLWTPCAVCAAPRARLSKAIMNCSAFRRRKRTRPSPIHPKAMPVILTSPAEFDRWLEADTSDVLTLQRPLPDDALRIFASGDKEDGAFGVT